MKTNVSKWTTALAVLVGGAMLVTSAMAQSGAAYPPAKSSPDTTKSDAPKADTKSSAPQADTSKSPSSPAATTGSAAGEKKPGAMKSDAMKSGPVQDSAQGADREQVKAVQQALKDKGHDPGEVDGAMGPKTEAALRDYQQKEGLKATGVADAATMAKLTASANLPAASPSAGSPAKQPK
jgi:peptidoglycan hydrolase-like protein with peptidoglycan-binding domain